MKQKFSCPDELDKFFIEELKKIVGVNARIDCKYGLFNYNIYPVGYDKCLWQSTLRGLFNFFSKYHFFFYVDFEMGKLHAYTCKSVLMSLNIL